MRVLHSWLQRYVPFTLSPEHIADRLTMLGLEFERIVDLGLQYSGFVVGKVVSCDRHPNADRLSVCQVDTGGDTLQIVCGAPNVAAGQHVVVGLPGATVPRNQHDPDGKPFVLGVVTLRGVASHGMICSAYELNLGNDHDGILVLDSTTKPGRPFASLYGLDDVVYDVEITPNRPDWLSHIGIAREIGVVVGKKVRLPKMRFKESTVRTSSVLKVRVDDPDHCPRFSARVIRGVTPGPSPGWLQRTLRNVGLRPRNVIVDITNYVMLEYGHPLHAFDEERLHGRQIIVRTLKEPTPFRTLDGKEHQIPAGTTMVCDAERAVSIAGVMGGENSEIQDTTTNIVLESAYWNPSAIRKAAKQLGLSTDASQRFERGADPNATVVALDRATHLITTLAGGEVLRGAIDIYPRKVHPALVPLRFDRVNAVLGTSLRPAEIIRMLGRLEFQTVRRNASAVTFRIPTFRVDVAREVDLIEEVARVHGYDNIEEKTTAAIDFSKPQHLPKTTDRLRSILIGGGFQECITNPMHEKWKAELGTPSIVTILNPQNRDMEALRTSLVPGVIDTILRNKNFGNPHLKLFEIGHVFSRSEKGGAGPVKGFLEQERVCIALSGLSEPLQWKIPSPSFSLYDLKGEVERLLTLAGLDKSELISYSSTDGLTDQTLAIEINKVYAGYLGRVRSTVVQMFGTEGEIFVAELDVEKLGTPASRSYEALAKFPGVSRDLALIVQKGTAAGEVEKNIRKSASSLLQSVTLFDVYEGEKIPPDTKSLAFALAFQSPEKTLIDDDVEREMGRIVESVSRTLGATMRGS